MEDDKNDVRNKLTEEFNKPSISDILYDLAVGNISFKEAINKLKKYFIR